MVIQDERANSCQFNFIPSGDDNLASVIRFIKIDYNPSYQVKGLALLRRGEEED